jgi:DNA processing protein
MQGDMLLYQIAITLVPGIGSVFGKKLIAHCGTPESIFREPAKMLKKIPRLSDRLLTALRDPLALEKAEKEVRFIEKYKITPLYFKDKEYPTRLKNCIDSPILLYFKGNADLNSQKVVAIVGTRSATDYGREICSGIISGLSNLQVVIVSGLAYGIDSSAHRAALSNGLPTIGVLGHGLDRIYPGQNKGMAEKMITSGGLLTDFTSGTKPDRENFPMRNRIIAGISDAIVVVEAANKGGALITAEIGNSYNRDVFAVPGKIGDLYSEGTNFLIKTNKAALIQSADDIKYLMGWDQKAPVNASRQRKLFIELTPDEEKIVTILSNDGNTAIDELAIKSCLSMNKCSAALLNLEFEGIVRTLPGRIYSLV